MYDLKNLSLYLTGYVEENYTGRILLFNFYSCADQIHIPPDLHDSILPENITSELIIRHDTAIGEKLGKDAIIVEWLTLNFAMKDRNPMDFIRFFTKYDPNTTIAIPKEHISSFIPNHFKEIIIRVFVRDARLAHRVQVAFRKLLESINSTLLVYSPAVVCEEPSASIHDSNNVSKSTPAVDNSSRNPFYIDAKKFSSPESSRHIRSGFPSPQKLEASAGLTLPENFPDILLDSPLKKRKVTKISKNF